MNQPETLLSLDTTSPRGSVSVLQKGRVLSELDWCTEDSHTEWILQKIEQVRKEAGIEMRTIEGLVVLCGPGSFTGIRIGLGIVMGLAEPAQTPIFPVSNLDAIASASAPDASPLQVVLDAGRNQVYTRSFQKKEQDPIPLDLPACREADSWLASLAEKKEYLCGSGVEKYRDRLESLLPGRYLLTVPKILAVQAGIFVHRRLCEGKIQAVEIPEAIYIRPPDIFRTQRNPTKENG